MAALLPHLHQALGNLLLKSLSALLKSLSALSHAFQSDKWLKSYVFVTRCLLLAFLVAFYICKFKPSDNEADSEVLLV